MDIIYGRNTVKSAIKSGRSLDKLMAARELDDPSVREILTLAAQRHIPILRVDKRKLDSLTLPFGFGGKPANHQGVVAVTPAMEYAGIEDILTLAAQRGEPPFIVLLDGVTDEGNLGSIIRSAEVLGAHGVIIGKHRSASLSATVCKAASGAAELLPVAKVTNLTAAIETLKEKKQFGSSRRTQPPRPPITVNLTAPSRWLSARKARASRALVLKAAT
jgi:23S rRNA (guanosine2251-2'-O)-methyltransferase